MPSTRILDLHRLLTPETIFVGLPGRTKEEVIEALVARLADHPAVKDLETIRTAVFEREAKMSTGVGKGVGLPHAKTHGVRESVALFAVTEHPIAFDAMDEQPVRLLFMLVGTEAAKSQHIRILSRVSRLLNRDGLRARLLDAASPQEVRDIFEDGELQMLDG